MTIDADELDRLREMAADGLGQGGGISGAFKAGQWAESHREELCRAVLRLATAVEEQRRAMVEQEALLERLAVWSTLDEVRQGMIS